jgi:antitoxin Phd
MIRAIRMHRNALVPQQLMVLRARQGRQTKEFEHVDGQCPANGSVTGQGRRRSPPNIRPLTLIVDMTTLVLVVTDGCKAMKELQLREAKSTLSAVVEAAEQGEPTTITKHGRPAAVVISHEEWTKLKCKVPSFADLLLAVPQFTVEDLPERRSARIVREGAAD